MYNDSILNIYNNSMLVYDSNYTYQHSQVLGELLDARMPTVKGPKVQVLARCQP